MVKDYQKLQKYRQNLQEIKSFKTTQSIFKPKGPDGTSLIKNLFMCLMAIVKSWMVSSVLNLNFIGLIKNLNSLDEYILKMNDLHGKELTQH
jgi:hypothetical protein